MDPILLSVPQLAAYQPALAALIILCLAVLTQGFLAGVLGLAGGEQVAGMPLKGDHGLRSFRILRTYGNSTENLPVMLATTGLAIIAGVSAALVNWLVILHVGIRLAYWAIYYSGVGKVGGGLRTISYVGAFMMNVMLAFATAFWLLF
ncbi:MAG: MAPEG family protein [Ahrensia sp.]|nr:MAPEG family protein [Ahrensia sp.]